MLSALLKRAMWYFCLKGRFNIKPCFGQRVVHHLNCITASMNTASIPKKHLVPHVSLFFGSHRC